MKHRKTTRIPRLFIEEDLYINVHIQLIDDDMHYVKNVMRKNVGDFLKLFNGRHGEWLAEIVSASKKEIFLSLTEQIREQKEESDIWLIFAPIKLDRMSYLIEKATEMGVSKLQPILLKHSVVDKVNIEKINSQVKEAAEQCERLSLPQVEPLIALNNFLSKWDPSRQILFANERGEENLSLGKFLSKNLKKEYAILIGPEGGFAEEEIKQLESLPYVSSVSLGPRILRAETAAIAALACYQSIIGDWV
jgi:16S rRNA (uracil1498-N3)-methyltransferase